MKLGAASVEARRHSLQLQRSRSRLMHAARTLKVDLIEQPKLVWLVHLVLALDHLPAGWDGPLPPRPPGADSPKALGKVKDFGGALALQFKAQAFGKPKPRFENVLAGTETEEHPVLGFVRSTLRGLQVREE